MQNMKLIPRHQTNGLAFSTFSKEEVLKMSVLEVTNPNAVDILGHPTANGVHDPRFGSIEIKEACVTCGSFSSNCYGHFGHIVLPVPVFNPVLTTITFQGSCLKCCHMMASQETTMLLLYQLMALNHGLTSVAMDMEEVVSQIVADNHSLTSDDVKLVKEKLEGMITDAVGGGESKLNESSKMDVMVKSVVDCRNIVIGNYFSAIAVGKTCCPWCSCKRRTMYLESQARIILGVRAASVKKPLVKTTAKKKKRSKKKEDDDEELEEDLFPHQEEAENTMTNDNVEEFTPENQVYMSHIEAREHLLKVYKNEHLILDQIFGSLVDSKTDSSKVSPIEGLFLEVLPVSPTRFRPMCTLNGEKFVNPHSSILNRLVQECIQLRHVMLMIQRNEVEYPEELKYLTTQVAGKTPIEKMHHLWFNLQVQVNSIYHGSTDKVSLVNIGGVKQLLEKKEGMFRMYMMGKRVNYAARSVISPDPYINVDEIGIPDVFAKKLTYPQPVTPWNIKQMRQAVINGPKVHPGAVLVQNEDGSTVALSENSNQREAIAKQLLTPCLDNTIKRCKIVYRHLQNGDILLVNRQPTLHKPSIMAHKACILVGEKTLRLNYSNCKSYNADFDGDEMNAHFPQGEVARAEAYGIVSVNHQYLVPKDGTPLGGLIQDHIISSVLLMIRGKFFGREDYQQLVFGALTNRRNCVQLLHPSILKPCVLWSGKQVVSTVIINTIPIGNHLLSLTGKSKIPSKSWLKSTPRNWLAGGTKLEGVSMTESEVVIRNGEVLCGILDKAHCGPTPFGLIHCCYELYGGEVSGLLLSHLGRLFTHFLQIEGFTLGVKDILVTSKADKKRTHYMRKARKIGVEVVCDALNVDKEDADPETLNEKMAAAHLSQDDVLMKQLDLSMKVRTDELNNKINKVCVPDGLLQHFPDNNLQLMILSGAKGATVNSMQISCMLGQIELEGCRPRPMGSGKTLPSFVPYDPSPRAGGFVDCRFLTGVRPQEYFFHCMAGREGLIDTAVKTSRSGYLQRCLIKHMEGVGVGYDLTVRDSDGSVIQFQYGEDSLDIVKIPFLCKEQFPFLLENLKSNQQNEKEEALAKGKHYQKTMKKTKKVRKFLQKEELEKESLSRTSLRTGSYLNFSKQNLAQLKTEFPGLNLKTRREYGVEKLMEMWYNMDEIEKSKYEPRLRRDPVTSRLRSDTTLGAISEKMDYIIESYLKEVPVGYEKKRDDIRTMLHQKVMRSMCEPGEAVGLLAAQSIGEPSTQMTLNTFHFAGRGEMNVTLGIPRLREILMTASANIATPTLEVPFLANISKLEKKAEKLKQKLTKVFLSEVLEKISINESIIVKPGVRKRVYRIRFHLLPYKYYKHDLYVTPAKILYFVEHVFLLYFIRVAKKKLNIMQSSTLVSNAAMRETHGAHTGGGEEKDYLKEKDGADVEEGGEKDDGVNDEGLAANRNDESSEDEHDDDAVAVKNRNRHKQEQEYDDEQNDDMEYREEDDDDDDEEDTFLSNNSKLESEEDDPTDVSESERPLSSQEWTTNISDTEITSRIAHVLSLSSFFTDYNFDTENEEWWEVTIQVGLTAKRLDMITLLVEEAKKSVVHETPGINRAFVVDRTDEKGNKQKLLKTDGINIQEIFNNDKLLDLNRLYCNDIHAMANTYGIEAAFRVIVKEVQNVFRVYGIEINPRHLLLVADYMTFDGAYHAFNRKNLEKNASPLQQMTFEATTQFLKQATFMGFKDPIKSPSARLIVGRLVNCGTGSFSMMQPIIT